MMTEVPERCLQCDGSVTEDDLAYFERPLCSDWCSAVYAAEREADTLMDIADGRRADAS